MRGNVTKLVLEIGVSYKARVDLPADPRTGKRRWRSTNVRTKMEAEAQVGAWLTEVATAVPVQVTTMTVADFLQHRLKNYVDDNVRSTTRRSYEQHIRNHLIPHLGTI